VVSAGGVLGGAFVGFVAPVVFPGIWEYPMLLVAALAGIPSWRRGSAAARRQSRPGHLKLPGRPPSRNGR